MNKWLSIMTIILTLTVRAATVQAVDKIAVVNMSNIFQRSPQRALVAEQLENEFKDRANELQFIEQDLNTKMQILRNKGSKMKSSERNALEKLVIKQKEVFSTKAQSFEQDNHRRQTEERNKILNHIQDAVKSVAIKDGYNIVIDSSAVAYADNNRDITTDVIKQVK